MLAGCTAPDHPAERGIGQARQELDGPLAATLINKIGPQTLGKVTNFGVALALEGNTLAAGNDQFDDGAPRLGAIFMFERGLDGFSQVDVLGLGTRTGSSLGGIVALDGSRLATSEFGGFSGNQVTVYERRGSRFEFDARLAPPGTVPAGFPASIAVSRDTIVAGSIVFEGEPGTGSAYAFVRGPSGWSQQARLLPGALTIRSFGSAVAIENDLVAVGFPADNLGPSVWLFERSGAQWTERARLAASDANPRNRFGQALAISAGRVYVGAPAAYNGGPSDGAVYEYTPFEGEWLEQKLTIDNGVVGSEFGSVLSADWPRLLVGTPSETGGGAAYLLSAETGEWDGTSLRMAPSDRTFTDEFGRSVALSGGTAVIGAPYHDLGGRIDHGVAYVYAIGLAPSSLCATSADCAGWCVDGICCDKRCAGACQTCRASLGAVTDGTCTNLPLHREVPGCLPRLCDGTGQCPTDCAAAGCSASFFCELGSGNCLPRRGAGAPCSGHTQCLSSFCDDGVCCDRICDGCSSCKGSLTGSVDGACAPVFAGTDPRFVCEADPGFPANCGADGRCDGNGQCRRFAPTTTPCDGAARCVGNTISGKLCNGLGGCGQAQASCAPNLCRDGYCSESCRDDRDCSDNAFCSSAGFCVPERSNGAACQRDAECASGSCTDGVCCSSRCDGRCEWCRGLGTVGTCTAVVGAPMPGRAPCASIQGDDSCATAQCNGVDRKQCTRAVIPCGAYGCDHGECKTSCTRRTSSTDCVAGAVCLDPPGRCIEAVPPCDPSVCSPYACDGLGACETRCSSSLECAGGHSCTSRGECIRRDTSGGFGCACHVVTPRTGPSAWWLVAFFAPWRRGLRAGPRAQRSVSP
jgi:hypothetical protein